MSRTRIVKGNITKITGGDHKVYSTEDISFSSLLTVNQKGDKDGLLYGKNEEPILKGQHSVLDAYFAIEEEGGYKKINSGSVGDELYILVKTYGLKGKSLAVNIKDRCGVLTEEEFGILNVIYKDKVQGLLITEVGEDNLAKFKIKLQPKEDINDIQNWDKKILDSSENKVELCILVDAHSMNQGLEIKYYGRNGKEHVGDSQKASFNNYWLDDNHWFLLNHNMPIWMSIVFGEEGINERTDSGYKRVKEYYKVGAGQGGLDPIKNAWCASFANWVFIETNRKFKTKFSYIPPNGHTNNPALAINFVNKDRYPGGKVISPSKRPPYGAILIIKKKGRHEGHATFVLNYIKTIEGFTIVGLGGNQNHQVRGNEYDFKLLNNKYIYISPYGTHFEHKGYVVPKNYEFNENNKKYYRYKNVRAIKAGKTR